MPQALAVALLVRGRALLVAAGEGPLAGAAAPGWAPPTAPVGLGETLAAACCRALPPGLAGSVVWGVALEPLGPFPDPAGGAALLLVPLAGELLPTAAAPAPPGWAFVPLAELTAGEGAWPGLRQLAARLAGSPP